MYYSGPWCRKEKGYVVGAGDYRHDRFGQEEVREYRSLQLVIFIFLVSGDAVLQLSAIRANSSSSRVPTTNIHPSGNHPSPVHPSR